MSALVSVIIPVYNGEGIIRRCLSSLCAQTFRDFEVIVVNDCSTDGTGEAVRKMTAETDIAVRLIDQPVNKGVACARNTGLKAAVTPYVYFIDADDTVYPDALQTLVEAAHEHDADMTCGGHDITGTASDKHLPLRFSQTRLYSGDDVFATFASGEGWHVMPWNKLLRRDFLLSHDLFFIEELRFHEDYVWNIFVAHCAERVCVVARQTYEYVINSQSITNSLSRERNLQGYCVAFDCIASFYRANGICGGKSEYALLEGKKSGVMYSLLQIGDIALFNKYYPALRRSVCLSPLKAWRLGIISASYLVRDLHNMLPITLGRWYKRMFYNLYYKWRGRKIEGAVWN